MDNKLITICITLVVGVILAGSLLVPVLNDTTKTHQTFVNEGLVYMDKYGTDASLEISWDHTTPDVLTVGDETVTLPQNTAFALTTVGNSTFFARYTVENSIAYFQTFSNGAGTDLNANTNSGTDMSISIASGTVTATVGESTKTYTYDDYIFIASESGDYVMKSASDTVHVLGDSDIYGFGRSKVGSTYVNFSIEGTISDGFTIEPMSYATSYEVGDYSVTAPANNKYINVYDFSKIDFDVTNLSTEAVSTVTYSQVIVPTQVTAELTNHMTPGEISLMGAIPVMVIIALVIVALGGIYFGRKD